MGNHRKTSASSRINYTGGRAAKCHLDLSDAPVLSEQANEETSWSESDDDEGSTFTGAFLDAPTKGNTSATRAFCCGDP